MGQTSAPGFLHFIHPVGNPKDCPSGGGGRILFDFALCLLNLVDNHGIDFT